MEPLNNSSLNYSETKKKNAIFFFSHFQWPAATENGDTSLCRGSSEYIRPSLYQLDRVTGGGNYSREVVERVPLPSLLQPLK
jgi:hypothetical protein